MEVTVQLQKLRLSCPEQDVQLHMVTSAQLVSPPGPDLDDSASVLRALIDRNIWVNRDRQCFLHLHVEVVGDFPVKCTLDMHEMVAKVVGEAPVSGLRSSLQLWAAKTKKVLAIFWPVTTTGQFSNTLSWHGS
jgi:hypothetical protein